ncbi:penicillin acylase family protein, partial [Kitasatospora sp. NPDC047058]|uniref:penicillin acylase family protein n=1 Tax=Kitasatospora sp. NPDC047058 TaxID=3155620 RepID=UPI0033DBE741
MAVAPLPAQAAGPGQGEERGGGYTAKIRRTEYGVPHIVARDFGGLGFGYGYAFAQDNLCQLADHVVTLRGERSRWFGPDGASADDHVLVQHHGTVELAQLAQPGRGELHVEDEAAGA